MEDGNYDEVLGSGPSDDSSECDQDRGDRVGAENHGSDVDGDCDRGSCPGVVPDFVPVGVEKDVYLEDEGVDPESVCD